MVNATGQRAKARCLELGFVPYSVSDTHLFRPYLSVAHAKSVDRISEWMQEAGMSVRVDSAANLIGRYEGKEVNAPTFLIGSHIDSVRDAGCFDGPLGVMLGIECVADLFSRRERLSFAIEVIAFGDEEGSRFPVSMLCSRAVAGKLIPVDLDVADEQGETVLAALASFRSKLHTPMSSCHIMDASRQAESVIGYLEAHIEQGPVLEHEDLKVGVVSGIAAQLRYDFIVKGMAGHAGTNAMHLRRDALTGASEIILAIERSAREEEGDLVATVGKIEAEPGAVNVVPGHVKFSLDIRSGNQDIRNDAARKIIGLAENIAADRGLQLEYSKIQDLSASPCDKKLTALLSQASVNEGFSEFTLVSGAGHDAMVVADLCPTSMLFVRCEEGISHHPAENILGEDADAALKVMTRFLKLLEEDQNG